MASRKEEKERLRAERLEQEDRERRAAARGKRLQYVIGGLLAVGIVAAVVIAVLIGGGGDGSDGDGPSQTASSDAELEQPKILDEMDAAKAAGCENVTVPNEGSTHENRDFTADDYDSNPPTSGNHFPQAAATGVYENGPPPLGTSVHALEHGRIEIQYKPGTPANVIDQLRAFFNEKQGYLMLLFENQTGMEAQVAATAWDHKLTCDEFTPETIDAMRTFYDAHLDKGPEKVPVG